MPPGTEFGCFLRKDGRARVWFSSKWINSSGRSLSANSRQVSRSVNEHCLSSRIPDFSRIVRAPLIVPRGVDKLPQIVTRAPAEFELCLAVVHPVRVKLARDVDAFEVPCRRKIASHLAIVDRFIHADIVEFRLRRGVVQGKEDR